MPTEESQSKIEVVVSLCGGGNICQRKTAIEKVLDQAIQEFGLQIKYWAAMNTAPFTSHSPLFKQDGADMVRISEVPQALQVMLRDRLKEAFRLHPFQLIMS